MHLDRDHPSNRGVLDYFPRNTGESRNTGERAPLSQPITDPAASKPQSGSHPEIVDYLWDTLASALPVECRGLVCGRAVLLGPVRGIIFAVPLGTEYGLRLPPTEFEAARSAGGQGGHHHNTAGGNPGLPQRVYAPWVFAPLH